MPKSRKKAKAKKLKSRSKGKPKKTDERGKGSVALLTAVIDRLGASVATYRDRKHELIVAHFNHPPFLIDLKRLTIMEVPTNTEATNVTQPDAA